MTEHTEILAELRACRLAMTTARAYTTGLKWQGRAFLGDAADALARAEARVRDLAIAEQDGDGADDAPDVPAERLAAAVAERNQDAVTEDAFSAAQIEAEAEAGAALEAPRGSCPHCGGHGPVDGGECWACGSERWESGTSIVRYFEGADGRPVWLGQWCRVSVAGNGYEGFLVSIERVCKGGSFAVVVLRYDRGDGEPWEAGAPSHCRSYQVTRSTKPRGLAHPVYRGRTIAPPSNRKKAPPRKVAR